MPEITRPKKSQLTVGAKAIDIVQPESKIRQQNDRPAAKAIRKRTEHRREDELHQRPNRAEQAVDLGGSAGVAAHETLDQLWQNGNDDSERQHVEQDGKEDERQSRAAHTLRKKIKRKNDKKKINCKERLLKGDFAGIRPENYDGKNELQSRLPQDNTQ
jgi:hypothetical protein